MCVEYHMTMFVFRWEEVGFEPWPRLSMVALYGNDAVLCPGLDASWSWAWLAMAPVVERADEPGLSSGARGPLGRLPEANEAVMIGTWASREWKAFSRGVLWVSRKRQKRFLKNSRSLKYLCGAEERTSPAVRWGA